MGGFGPPLTRIQDLLTARLDQLGLGRLSRPT